MTRDECLKLLRDNEAFKTILSKATSDAERRAIKAYTEDFVLKVYGNMLDPLGKVMATDPNAVRNAYQEVSNSLIKSGSIEQED